MELESNIFLQGFGGAFAASVRSVLARGAVSPTAGAGLGPDERPWDIARDTSVMCWETLGRARVGVGVGLARARAFACECVSG